MKKQPGLRDIGRTTVPTEIGGVTLQVRGLSARDLFELMQRFEGVRTMLESGRAEVERKISRPQTLIATLPGAVWSAMATCTGSSKENREADERAASELPLGDQVTLLNAIFEATFREGVGPFMKMIGRLTELMTPPKEDSPPPQASRNVSPQRSPASLHVDLGPERLGRLHLAS